MATHSLIGMELEDGSVEAIYCHFDGYLDNNGRILINNYTSPEKVSELISLGGITSLGIFPSNTDRRKPPGHSGEGLGILRFSNLEDYVYYYHNGTFIEYVYLFNRNGEWEYMDMADEGQLVPIPDKLIETNI